VDNRFYLSTQKAAAKSHLSKLSKWKEIFERLYDRGWNGSKDYMWILISADEDLDKKLKIFFKNNKRQMEDVASIFYHAYGIIDNYHDDTQIEFGGIDLRSRDNIDHKAYHKLRMRLLLIDAILDYCDSRSAEDIERKTWDDFWGFICNRKSLKSYLRKMGKNTLERRVGHGLPFEECEHQEFLHHQQSYLHSRGQACKNKWQDGSR